MALVHCPVKDKNGETIASAVTNLDLHDIARAARTYGVKSYYVVTPLLDQQELVRTIIDHWVTGYGATYNPKRREALELLQVAGTIAETVDRIGNIEGTKPRLIGTSARHDSRNIGFKELRERFSDEKPYLLTLGTAWGLTAEFMEDVEYILEPVQGAGSYNHLSVRAAAAIILDRLLGRDDIS
ncbi:MAG: RNA methyltransferase [Desulfobacteraceae bacterium]|nr:RNA methyltransferase [Desulfobacteraceae bacterium]